MPEHGDSRYSLFNDGHLLTIQMRERAVLKALAAHGYSDLHSVRVLEVGAGTGGWLRDFIRWGASPSNLFGVDLDCERISRARELSPAGVTLECGDARQLRHSDGMFDIVLQSTLFSSLLDATDRQAVASEMLRVRKSAGSILWYDMRVNNPKNPKVRRITKLELKALFPGQSFAIQRITLAPPIARKLAKRAWVLSTALTWLAPLTTHYLAVIESPK